MLGNRVSSMIHQLGEKTWSNKGRQCGEAAGSLGSRVSRLGVSSPLTSWEAIDVWATSESHPHHLLSWELGIIIKATNRVVMKTECIVQCLAQCMTLYKYSVSGTWYSDMLLLLLLLPLLLFKGDQPPSSLQEQFKESERCEKGWSALDLDKALKCPFSQLEISLSNIREGRNKWVKSCVYFWLKILKYSQLFIISPKRGNIMDNPNTLPWSRVK